MVLYTLLEVFWPFLMHLWMFVGLSALGLALWGPLKQTLMVEATQSGLETNFTCQSWHSLLFVLFWTIQLNYRKATLSAKLTPPLSAVSVYFYKSSETLTQNKAFVLY